MNELFSWVPWFQELAQEIAEGGPEQLSRRARKIAWKADGTQANLLKYGDKNIDPFSVFYVLASKNHWDAVREQVHAEISAQFHLATQADFASGYYYPTPDPRAKLLFHDAGDGDPDLIWRLLRAAVQGPDAVAGSDFDHALAIPGVGIPKLTETLFLINPRGFLPFDKQSLNPLRKKLNRDHQVNNWEAYRREVDAVRGLFPGCEPYEIQHFAYAVFGTKELDVKDGKVWRGSTNVGKDEPDGWKDFRENGRIHYREPPTLPFALRHPDRGDIVLVHRGLFDGRGIGVVRRNDHKARPTAEQPLRVLWLNTSTALVDGVLSGERFSAAKKALGTFRGNRAYAATFDLLTRLGWGKGGDRPDKEAPGPDKNQEPPRPPDFQALEKDTLIPKEELEKISELLKDKKQVIFQGPPGTGKTYLARKLAECLAGSRDHVRLVQFHPSYAYEDFVQGYRPTLKDGQAGFELRDGPLRKMAKLAKKSEEKHFLIIDEINRGNLAKILGELYFLLEYRDYKIPLQYTNKPFFLPPNLYIIGTMNTADRSIARVDLALRRRFHFVEFHPDKPPIEGLLGEYLRKHTLSQFLWIEDVLKKANEKLAKLDDRHAAIGPSYFMDEGLDSAKIEMIWKHSVLPYIEERLFGQEDRLKEFELDRLRQEVEGQATVPEGEAADGGSGTDEFDHGAG